MAKTVKFKGNPMTLIGREADPGMTAPYFKVTAQDMSEKGLDDFKGKIKVIASFPSLDTPVCDLQVKEFNKRSASFSPDVVVIGISKDLPFAQARFCQEHEIKNFVLSDYKYSSFGIQYGLLIRELNLLARSVMIIDKNDIIRYVQVVDELTSPPDYEAAVKALSEVVKMPESEPRAGKNTRCVPCEIGTPPLSKDRILGLLPSVKGWDIVDDKKIVKEFKFKDFSCAKTFVDAVSVIAEEEGHHPSILVSYNKVRITLTTHASGGLTDNDFIMAGIIDKINA